MIRRAVTFGTDRSDHQQWSTLYSYKLTVLVLVFSLMGISGLWAQTSTTGNIAGVVTDPTGAVVPGASVTLRNLDTGISTSKTSNAECLCLDETIAETPEAEKHQAFRQRLEDSTEE